MEANAAFFDPRRSSLGDTLVTIGVITADQLLLAQCQQGTNQKNLGQVLVKLGFATESKIAKALSLHYGIAYFETFEGMLEPEMAKLVPETMARRHLVVPVMETEEGVVIAMVNPIDVQAIDDLTRQTGKKILPVMTPFPNLMQTVDALYHSSPP